MYTEHYPMCTGWMDLRGRRGVVIATGSGLLEVLYEEAQPDIEAA